MLMLRPQPHPAADMGYHHHQAAAAAAAAAAAVDAAGPYGHSWTVPSCILEMRKEKSRDAARSRRGKENYEFYELAKMLPLPAAITSQLDKASIIRLTISYLKLRDFSQHGHRPWLRDMQPSKALKGASLRGRSINNFAVDIFEQHQGTHILQSLDGFTFALGADGRFLYISETVSIYLGLSQVEMTGSSVFDYVHHQDHAELAEQLGINLSQSVSSPSGGSGGSDDGSSTPNSLDRPAPVMTLGSSAAYKGLERSFCVRMKSTLTKRGCHFKSSGYRVVLVLCHLRPQYSFSPGRSKQPPQILGMVAMAIALPPPSVNEVRLECDMFVTRLGFDFRVAHCEPRVADLLDYSPEDLAGRNLYTLVHGQDVQKLRKCHVDLMNKGQVMSGYYRIMNKNGGFTWMQTCATVICNNKNSEEQSIICVNYVLSGVEYEHCVMDCSQMRGLGDIKPDDPSNSERGSTPDNEPREERSPGRAAEPSPKSHEAPPSSTPALGGSQDVPSAAEQQQHLTQLGAVGKLDSLRNAKIRGTRRSDSNYIQMACHTYVDAYQEGAEHPSASPARYEAAPAGNAKSSRKRSSDEAAGGSRASPKCSRPGSRASSLQPPSPARSLPPPDGYGRASEPPLVVVDDPASSSSTGAVSSQGGPTSGNGDDSCDGPDGLSRPWKAGGGSGQVSTGEGLTVRELEDAMKKHLPEVRSTRSAAIQWIGAPHQSGAAGASPHAAGGPLPASTLLRQLYVNRESVIRSGSHVSAASSRPTYYGDVPTPPEGPWTTPDAFVLPPYAGYVEPPPPFSAVTPPSSVSPRDNKLGLAESPAFSEAAAVAAAAAMPHMRHYVSAAELPLKPQVLVHPGSLDYATPQEQQLYAGGFHLYGKPNGAWYSQQPNT
ncbi:protein trachealess isoform X2 [Dermacentor andersoni]|uniref:protein trachealess isoform X2 n=1 Tax=Dermacentor andersoni TaxID=34620 RepID=UPI002415AB28|nr:protein trachealess-like isoform X2 [Dermacentor andersoni]